ncbi:MAG TPA: MarR family transcriptional regulator [Cellulomonas sp.]
MPHTPAYRVLIDAISHLGRVQRELGTVLARDLDCPRTSLSLLWLLDRTGDLGIGDIAQHLHVDISVASRQATALVDAGYAERRTPSTPGTDRRVRPIGLTRTGRDFTAQTRRELDERAGLLFGTWSIDDLLTAAAALDRIAETLAEHSGDLAELRTSLERTADQATAPTTSGVLAGTTT